MKVGIIVYSHSGHTLAAAQHLKERLSAAGHQPALERLELAGPAPAGREEVPLKNCPDISAYNAVVFCSPVHGGRPALPLTHYLAQLPPQKGRPAVLLVTHFFRPDWGAELTIAALRAACETRGARVIGAASVRWPGLGRSRRLESAADEMLRALG